MQWRPKPGQTFFGALSEFHPQFDKAMVAKVNICELLYLLDGNLRDVHKERMFDEIVEQVHNHD